MTAWQGRLLLALGFVLLPGKTAAADLPLAKAAPIRTDALGDPLPPGAVGRLGTLRLRHDAAVVSLAFSPDGKLLAASGGHAGRWTGPDSFEGRPHGQVRLWDARTGREIHALRTPRSYVTCLTFSPDGKVLAAVCDAEVYLWDVDTGKLLRRLQGGELDVTSLAFTPDGRLLHAAAFSAVYRPEAAELYRWEVATGRLLSARQEATKRPRASPTAKKTLALLALQVSPDGRHLFKSFGADPELAYAKQAPTDLDILLEIHDFASGKLLRRLPLRADPRCLAISADGNRFAVSGTTGVAVGKTGSREAPRFLGEAGGAGTLALSPAGQRLACWRPDGSISIWDTAAAKATGRLDQFRGSSPNALAFAADSRTLAVAYGNLVRLWDADTGNERIVLPGPRDWVWHVSYTADGRSLVTDSGYPASRWHDAAFCTWDVDSCRELRRVPWSALNEAGECLASSPDGRFYVHRAAGGTTQLRSVDDGKVIRTLRKTTPDVTDNFVSPDGNLLLWTTLRRGKTTLKILAAATGREIGRVSGTQLGGKDGGLFTYWRHRQRAITPDGKLLAWMDRLGRISLLDVPTSKITSISAGPPQVGLEDPWMSSWLVALSPDGRYLFSSVAMAEGLGNTAEPAIGDVSLWSLPEGKRLRRLAVLRQDGRPAGIACAAFSPDGRTLAVGAYGDSSVSVWEVASGKQRQRFDGHRAAVLSVAFAPDGRTLASGSEDGTVLLWDLTGRR